MDRSQLAIVIPAFNEITTIGRIVCDVLRFGIPIVVDDASSDGTGVVAEASGAHVISHEANRGYDGALNSGFAVASERGFEYVITLDADGQHMPELIETYVRLLEGGADIVVGIRPQKARLAEQIFGWTAKQLYGVCDPLCGMKGYKMSLYRDAGRFDSYGSVGTELTLYAAKNGYRISQIEVPIRVREAGTPRYGQRLRANCKILRALVKGVCI